MKRYIAILISFVLFLPFLEAEEVITSPDSLVYRSGTPGTLYLWVPYGIEEFNLSVYDVPINEGNIKNTFMLYSPDENLVVKFDESNPKEWITKQVKVNKKFGIWKLTVVSGSPPEGEEPSQSRNDFMIKAQNVYPFLLSGLGSRISFSSPKFEGSDEFQLYTDVPYGCELITVQSNFYRKEGEAWVKPKESTEFLSLSSERANPISVKERYGWWNFKLKSPKGEYQFSIEQGLPLFFEPITNIPYAKLNTIATEKSKPVAARVAVYRDKRILTIAYPMAESSAQLFLVPGLYTLVASRGVEYATLTKTCSLDYSERREIEFPMVQVCEREPGWIAGDSHMHTIHSDGITTENVVAIAAKAEGLDYAILTDHNTISGTEEFLSHRDEKFIPIRGEEVSMPHYHMNVLNTWRKVAVKEITPEETVKNVEYQSGRNRKTGVFLNHPGKDVGKPGSKEYEENPGWAPGKSWWVLDEVHEVVTIENAPFEPWFKRLNEGRKIAHIWNTDTHDAYHYPPGMARQYVYVGDDFSASAIVKAIVEGHSFSTRGDGALLFLYVDGHIPGETIELSKPSEVMVRIKCRSAKGISKVEIISEGEAVRSFQCFDSHTFDAEFSLEIDSDTWILSRAYIKEDVAAFTNPVYLVVLKM